MNREAFLTELRRRLSGLPEEELEERLAFYSEMIDDRMADGATEEEAVADIGPVDSVVAQVMAEIPLTQLVRDKRARREGMKGWQIALMIIGAPLWLPLLIAAAAIVLSLYVVLWAVVLSLYAADLALAAGAVAGLPCAWVYLKGGNPPGALFSVGTALLCAGLAILLFHACNRIVRGVLKRTGELLTGIKTSLVGKGV